MASGQIFVMVATPPDAKYAVEDIYNSTATTGIDESVPVWGFDAATTETMDFYSRAVGFSATGAMTLYGGWTTTSTATVNGVVWQAAFRRLNPDGANMATSLNYSFQSATDDAPLNDRTSDFTIAFTNGQINGLTASEAFILRLQRLATATGDSVTTKAYLLQGGVQLKET